MTEHEQKTIEFYAHDYRCMKQSEEDMQDMFKSFVEALARKHSCRSTCEYKGCNCSCGEFHF